MDVREQVIMFVSKMRPLRVGLISGEFSLLLELTLGESVTNKELRVSVLWL